MDSKLFSRQNVRIVHMTSIKVSAFFFIFFSFFSILFFTIHQELQANATILEKHI